MFVAVMIYMVLLLFMNYKK